MSVNDVAGAQVRWLGEQERLLTTPYASTELEGDWSNRFIADRFKATVAALEKAEADNARLRALIKEAELGTENYCPWCNGVALALDDGSHSGRHAADCKAFTQDRKVK